MNEDEGNHFPDRVTPYLASFGIDESIDKDYSDEVLEYLLFLMLYLNHERRTLIPVPALWRGDRENFTRFLTDYPSLAGHWTIEAPEDMTWCVIARHAVQQW